MAADDIERRRLPEHATEMEPDDDVRHHLHGRLAQRRERRLEIFDRPIEVIDLANRLRSSDHVHHRGIDPGRFHRERTPPVSEGRMNRDPQLRMVPSQPLEHRKETLVADLVAPIRAAGEQKTLQSLPLDHLAHLAIEHLRGSRRQHRLEDLRPAVLAVESAGAGGDGKGRKTVPRAAAQLRAGVILERRGGEADRPGRNHRARAFELGNKLAIERRIFQLLDAAELFQPTHGP